MMKKKSSNHRTKDLWRRAMHRNKPAAMQKVFAGASLLVQEVSRICGIKNLKLSQIWRGKLGFRATEVTKARVLIFKRGRDL